MDGFEFPCSQKHNKQQSYLLLIKMKMPKQQRTLHIVIVKLFHLTTNQENTCPKKKP